VLRVWGTGERRGLLHVRCAAVQRTHAQKACIGAPNILSGKTFPTQPTDAPCLSPPPPKQNKFLQPDAGVVDALVAQLSAKRVGVVAHFYMDPEVQGVLSSAGERRAGADGAGGR
jgi:hypothetical protein